MKHPVCSLLWRATAIAAVGGALGLLANAIHPMGLPLLLGEVPQSAIPLWVWRRVDNIGVDEAHLLWRDGSAIFVDTRNADDYAEGHVPGSISLPYHDFSNVYPRVRDQLPRSDRLVLYCYGSHCGLAMRLAKRLLRDGYQDLISLRGGIADWEAAGYEITRPGQAGEPGNAERQP